MKSTITVFVLHVKQGYEDRARHMERTLAAHGIVFEYMLDGDMTELTPELQQRFFGSAGTPTPHKSCAAKHLLTYEKIVRENIPYALIFEDDMFITKQFDRTFDSALREMMQRHGESEPFLVGFEATCMGFVPRSQRVKGQVAYPGRFLQCLGCYLVNKAFAQAILTAAETEKCTRPVDLWINEFRHKTDDSGKGLFHLYWSHPVVAVQGSHMGKFTSSIGNPVRFPLKNLRRSLTFFYKKILYFFR